MLSITSAGVGKRPQTRLERRTEGNGATAMLRRVSSLWLIGLLSLAACHAPQQRPRATGPAIGAAENWVSHGAAADETSFSRLDQINTQTVGKLGLAWALDLPGEASLEATPLAIGGVLYFTGSYGTVYAVDGGSGKILWSYDPQTWKHNPDKMHYSFAANRGVAYDN